MKKNIQKFKTLIAVVLLCGLAVTACRKMDVTYKDFIVPGGKTYPGKATDAKAHGGDNRIKISWPRGVDPNLKRASIFWNNKADSVVFDIPATGEEISYILTNMPEKIYSFIIRTYDDKGNASVPVEVNGTVYGANYQSSILNRFVASAQYGANQDVNIAWGPADRASGLYATEVVYTNNAGEEISKWFNASETRSVISDYKEDTNFKIRSAYLPDTLAIDTFYTPYEEKVVDKMRKFEKAAWTVTADSREERDDPTASLYTPAKAIDDNISTFWHTPWTVHTPFPHWLAVDMKQTFTVGYVELTCRQNNVKGITEFMIQGSMDGTTWTTYNTYNLIQQNATQRFEVSGQPQIRHIRIFATKGVEAPTHLAEFSVFGY
ncbi:DUF4998 domain-containing protein [Sphingobacterium pedocola]|uniref:F5/8 type C domain-containing protein n=1 Tax=Sphingobacterium pedocola TaxID=2082722 RepID=A0ABR9T7A3_9SPHI|nr:DUF4998 domain-containing protein [Sphingobacterium pedocola]MBE8721233.1 hypothetical protein [Sphingobacterium pedocola]